VGHHSRLGNAEHGRQGIDRESFICVATIIVIVNLDQKSLSAEHEVRKDLLVLNIDIPVTVLSIH
jgi:glycine/serine hydroxymethyltransferase